MIVWELSRAVYSQLCCVCVSDLAGVCTLDINTKCICIGRSMACIISVKNLRGISVGGCYFDEIFITGWTGSCQNDNFQCTQWWKFCAASDENFMQPVMKISSKWPHFQFGNHDANIVAMTNQSCHWCQSRHHDNQYQCSVVLSAKNLMIKTNQPITWSRSTNDKITLKYKLGRTFPSRFMFTKLLFKFKM